MADFVGSYSGSELDSLSSERDVVDFGWKTPYVGRYQDETSKGMRNVNASPVGPHSVLV